MGIVNDGECAMAFAHRVKAAFAPAQTQKTHLTNRALHPASPNSFQLVDFTQDG